MIEQTDQNIDVSDVAREIAGVLNAHGLDAQLNIPDFVLARFMLQTLAPLVEAVDLNRLFSSDITDQYLDA